MDTGFGHDFFAVRAMFSRSDRLKFSRAPRPEIQACLPFTYGFGPEQVSVRKLSVGHRPEPAHLTIGAVAVARLKELGVAEINVETKDSGLSLDNFAMALSLLAGNWERLMHPGPEQYGLYCRLLIDDTQCSSLVKSLTDHASDRLDGELFLSAGALSLDYISESHRLKIERPEVQTLFRDLRLVPPPINFDPNTNPIVQFDFIRVFSDGAAYVYKARMPFEFLMAEAA